MGAIHSTKISGNFGPKLNGSVRSNRKSFEKNKRWTTFSRSDGLEFWLNAPYMRACSCSERQCKTSIYWSLNIHHSIKLFLKLFHGQKPLTFSVHLNQEPVTACLVQFICQERKIHIHTKNSTLTGDVNKAGVPVDFQPLHCLKL